MKLEITKEQKETLIDALDALKDKMRNYAESYRGQKENVKYYLKKATQAEELKSVLEEAE